MPSSMETTIQDEDFISHANHTAFQISEEHQDMTYHNDKQLWNNPTYKRP